MAYIIRGMGEMGVTFFMDDILISSTCIKDDFNTLEEVLKRLLDTKLNFYFKKSTFCVKKTLYIGHVITNEEK